jgi:hypothetical protein
MPEMASYALPVYQAVVSGIALKALQDEEVQSNDCERLRQASELLSKFDELIAMFSRANFATVNKEDIEFIATGLALLVSISDEIVRLSSEEAKEIPDRHQNEFREKIAGIAADTDRTRELAEAWFMALDEELVSSLKKSIEESRPIHLEDVPEWRDVLAKLQD